MQAIQMATGIVVGSVPGRGLTFLGSCFSFRLSNTFLTAAHCIDGLRAEDLWVSLPTPGKLERGLRVQKVYVHPEADVAMLILGEQALASFYSFRDIDHLMGWGEGVQAYGYPEDTDPELGVQPNPRMFVGSLQRNFLFDDGRGTYHVAELNFVSPQGLSGGPLCRTQDQSAVLGIMCNNKESTIFQGAYEVLIPGGDYVTATRDITRYGLAVLLSPLEAWLDINTPAG